MGIILTLIALLAVQLLLGGALIAVFGFAIARGGKYLGFGRRRRLAWFEAASSLGRPLLLGLIVAAITCLPVLLVDRLRPSLPSIGLAGILGLFAGSIAVAGCTLLVRSGELEYLGHLSRSRRLVRVGGKTLFTATIGLNILLFSMWLGAAAGLRDRPEATYACIFGLIALGLAGFIGLLAGLSGKPRPSGGVAVALHLAGQVAATLALFLAATPAP